MRTVAVIVVVVTALAAVLSAQNVAPADGTTAALVSELRALRADLNRVAGASIRSQLLVGRLQLQEQRILTSSRQMDDVKKGLALEVDKRIAIERDIERLERVSDAKPEDRKHLENELFQLRRRLDHQREREQELRAQESSLSAMILDEQARWTDFNSRLDELERALVPGGRN